MRGTPVARQRVLLHRFSIEYRNARILFSIMIFYDEAAFRVFYALKEMIERTYTFMTDRVVFHKKSKFTVIK